MLWVFGTIAWVFGTLAFVDKLDSGLGLVASPVDSAGSLSSGIVIGGCLR